jgi:diguanylate cyclase (GGDEF)-like protein
MKVTALQAMAEPDAAIERLKIQLDREKKARQEAELIAERGLRDLYDSRRWLELLQRITMEANSSNELKPSLSTALGEICGHMSWDFGNTYFVSEDKAETRAGDIWYASEPVSLYSFLEESRAAVFRSGEGLPGRVLRDGQPHWIPDIVHDDNFRRRTAAQRAGLNSACAFPIMVGSDVVAIFEFFSRRTSVRNETLIETMAQIGMQLGRVIERDRSRAKLLHDALHDPLTSLPNRSLLAERVRAASVTAGVASSCLVMVLDLNGFKAVNDKYGHFAGDELIVQAARRIEQCVNELACQCSPASGTRSTVARVGGDEFVLLLEGAGWNGPAKLLPTALHHALAHPCEVQGDYVSLSASIGIARSSPGTSDVDQLLRDADLAMYEAKAKGRACTVEFTPNLGQIIRQRRDVEQDLRLALKQEEFCLHYQPIRGCGHEGRVEGYEALVRWEHPRKGTVGPGSFISIAEESGLIMFLGDWVLEESCRALSRLRRRGQPFGGRFISVNVAAIQFLQPTFPKRVSQLIMKFGIDPRQLRLEITESVAIRDPERTCVVLNEMRQWGVKTSLDDFGTGYSSLSYLQRLPFDSLKIDKSFIDDLENPKSRSIVRSIIGLAKEMNLLVVAEGVEELAQSTLLADLGCDLLQGYLFGRPMCEEDAFAWQ